MKKIKPWKKTVIRIFKKIKNKNKNQKMKNHKKWKNFDYHELFWIFYKNKTWTDLSGDGGSFF